MSKTPSNRERAEWASVALDAFADHTKTTFEDRETQLVDLLCDLMHFCDVEHIDWKRAVDHAGSNYATEKAHDHAPRQTDPRKTIFTVSEVASIAGVVPRNVTRWCDSGRLRSYRIPGTHCRRIQRDDLIQFLNDHGFTKAAHDLQTTEGAQDYAEATEE